MGGKTNEKLDWINLIPDESKGHASLGTAYLPLPQRSRIIRLVVTSSSEPIQGRIFHESSRHSPSFTPTIEKYGHWRKHHAAHLYFTRCTGLRQHEHTPRAKPQGSERLPEMSSGELVTGLHRLRKIARPSTSERLLEPSPPATANVSLTPSLICLWETSASSPCQPWVALDRTRRPQREPHSLPTTPDAPYSNSINVNLNVIGQQNSPSDLASQGDAEKFGGSTASLQAKPGQCP